MFIMGLVVGAVGVFLVYRRKEPWLRRLSAWVSYLIAKIRPSDGQDSGV